MRTHRPPFGPWRASGLTTMNTNRFVLALLPLACFAVPALADRKPEPPVSGAAASAIPVRYEIAQQEVLARLSEPQPDPAPIVVQTPAPQVVVVQAPNPVDVRYAHYVQPAVVERTVVVHRPIAVCPPPVRSSVVYSVNSYGRDCGPRYCSDSGVSFSLRIGSGYSDCGPVYRGSGYRKGWSDSCRPSFKHHSYSRSRSCDPRPSCPPPRRSHRR